MKSVLIIDDDPLIRKTLSGHLSKQGFEVHLAEEGEEGVRKFRESNPDVVLLDVRLPDIDGIEVLRQIRELNKKTYVLMMTAYDDMKTTIEAVKLGAFEYLVKPLNYIDLDLTVAKVFQVRALEQKVIYLVEERQKEYTIDNIIGRSPQMREVFKLIGSVANTRTNVLIQGESGTGKELVAKAIHYNSPYHDEPFIVINCSAITDTLLESELFGHARGAFTDAVAETKGKFEIAGKGTLFLDEIGDISPNLQSKLLRVIETRDFMKVGGEKITRGLRRSVRKIPPEVMAVLQDLPWRGNVRELENALTRAVILAKGDVVLKENLPLEPDERRTFSDDLVPLEEVEKKYIQPVLRP